MNDANRISWIVIKQRGHNVEFDQPEAAVSAIEKMVELTRDQTAVAAR